MLIVLMYQNLKFLTNKQGTSDVNKSAKVHPLPKIYAQNI